MATLAGNTIASTYPLLLKIDSNGIDGTLRAIEDGDGTDSAVKISTGAMEVGGDVSIISSSSASPTLLVKNTNDDGEPAYMQFIKDTSNSAADNDEIVKMEFYHDNDANSLVRYGAMIVSTPDVSNGSEDTKIKFMTRLNGTDTETLTLNSGKVGIGTTAPAVTTQIHSDAETFAYVTTDSDAHDTGIWLGHDIDGSAAYTGIVYDRSVYTLKLFNANSIANHLVIDNDGDVGIGVEAPSAKLHIAKDDGTMPTLVAAEAALAINNNSATSDGCTFSIVAGSNNNAQICFGHSGDYDEGVLAYVNSADDMTFRTAGSGEDMRLSSVGHLGIGCDPSDSYEIHVEASDTPVLALQDTTNNVVIGMSCDNSQTYVGSISNHTLVFETNDATRGWFTNTGTFNVREVTGTASNNAGKMTTSNASYATSLQLYGCARTSSDAWKVMSAYHGDGSNDEFNDVIFEVEGNGDVESDTGTYGTGASDYAEYFESKDGKAIAVGKTVKLDGGKVVACEDGDTPMGVVRPKQGACSVIGNKAQHSWHSKWLKNDYDEFILEDCTVTEWTEKVYNPKRDSELGMYRDEFHSYETDKIPSDVTVPDDAKVLTEDSNGNKLQRKKINPDYKADLKYEPREKRDSWCLIGLLGQIPITKGQPVSSNWIKMKDVSDTVEMYFVK